MSPPIFQTVKNDPAVQAALGVNPTRVYPFGRAPDVPADPYCVWRVIGGEPENYLSCRPGIDRFNVQFDVYGTSAASVEAAALALRNAIELNCHIVLWLGTDRDKDTGRYSLQFSADWWTHR